MPWHLVTLIFAAVGGYLVHAISMKVSFKQRTIDNKIKVFDSIITNWVRMRNFIYHRLLVDENSLLEFDKLYGDSQAFIGESVLVSDDEKLIEDINGLNERLYRTDWRSLGLEKSNPEMEDMKKSAIEVIKRMRTDIKKSTILEFSDFSHIFGGFRSEKR